MGFLMGAFGKLMAGQRVRNLQFRLTLVTNRHRRITQEIEQKNKMYQARERNLKLNSQAQMQMGMYNYLAGLASGAAGSVTAGQDGNSASDIKKLAQMQMSAMFGMGGGSYGTFDYTGISPNARYAFQTDFAGYQQAMQMNASMSQNMWQNAFEMEKEADLMALKDIEEELQTEKDSLESQIKIAEQDYQAYKEMEKQGAQNMKPDFTGQG